MRGYSLIGKTAILHIVISGSSPDISNSFLMVLFLVKIYLYGFLLKYEKLEKLNW